MSRTFESFVTDEANICASRISGFMEEYKNYRPNLEDWTPVRLGDWTMKYTALVSRDKELLYDDEEITDDETAV